MTSAWLCACSRLCLLYSVHVFIVFPFIALYYFIFVIFSVIVNDLFIIAPRSDLSLESRLSWLIFFVLSSR